MPEHERQSDPDSSIPANTTPSSEQPGSAPGGPPPGAGFPMGGPPSGVVSGGTVPPEGAMPPGAGFPMGGPPAGAGGAHGGPPHGGMGEPPSEDPMTGALNVPAFVRAFSFVLQGGLRDRVAVWYIDVRNFRSVNPNYGFLVGNVLLKSLVKGIREHISHDLPIARLGADRFIAMSSGVDFDECEANFKELVAELSVEAENIGIRQPVHITAGIYFLREGDIERKDFNRSLDYASVAHRNAKRVQKSCLVLFTDEDLERDRRRMTIEHDIDTALAEGQIEVWYQPQVDYIYGDIVGAEALARWNHPELGWITPSEFIPVLEKCGKVHDLDIYVWEEACRCAGKWRNAADGNPVPISVNVSRTEMFEDNLLEHFLELQRKYDLPKGSLHLEVTESAFVEEADRLYKVIERMRSHDLRVEMDDFGSGLSSLNMLKDVPVDVVKLDMGFMRTSLNEDRGGVVLSSAIRMLQGLDTPIIAEGVETLEQAEMLKNMGCRLMQGFHFSRPMPLEEFESFMSSSSSVESAERRARKESNLEEIMSFDPASSYLFNNAVGGMIVFYSDGANTESIMVNDAFYEACGLRRDQFGDVKVNPIAEIDKESQATMWRAAAEARERGSALCRAQVNITRRWFEGVMHFISSSTRGDVFSLIITRSGSLDELDNPIAQLSQDANWSLELFNTIVPNGFLKCSIDSSLTIDHISPELIRSVGLARDEFMRRFHNSLANVIVPEERSSFVNLVREASSTGDLIDCDITVQHGYDTEISGHVFGRVQIDGDGKQWLYCFIIVKGEINERRDSATEGKERIIPFDYVLGTDELTVRVTDSDGNVREIAKEGWLKSLEEGSDAVSVASSAKILATIKDLSTHPVSGFTDIKSDITGMGEQRWFHVNYTCEIDEDGSTAVIHGYAQDANDQMGSAKWWRRQAESDYLTGLLNRNAVEQEVNMAMRASGGGMMLMIDLDNFKRVNDDLGHLTGDALLRDIAEVLSNHFRESDVLGRYGGDEFVAFMPLRSNDALALAEKRASEIVRDISQIQIPDGTLAACSVGVAISRNREDTFYDLLEVADQAMYESKLKGKGTYTIHEL